MRYISQALSEGGVSSEILMSLNEKLDKLTSLGKGQSPEATFVRDQKTALFEGLNKFLKQTPGTADYNKFLDALDDLQDSCIEDRDAQGTKSK